MSTRDKRPAPGQPRRSSGVALGVLGIMLLAFFAIVFMLGRPSYRHQFEEFIHHPFDPHPIGIDKRHKDTTREWCRLVVLVHKVMLSFIRVVNVYAGLTTRRLLRWGSVPRSD